ncbi:MAG: hypothetical protein CMD46_06215 [Gammaproteobacteria bacterium]|nr:hypothetical protein [Gammaproteobacteria bacterium]|tara:strand:- start:7470 stop:8609 length:1140 start_codon:yes stop_codon:yes gene_type:complete
MSNFKFIESINSLKESEFNNLLDVNDSPFIKYGFLESLENSKSVSKINGWQPNHLTLFKEKKLDGFMPLYIKHNSHGEFVFDHQWSYALNRAGRNYYPKLLTAIPFTPCESKKIIKNKELAYEIFIQEVKDLMHANNIETWHILFPDEDIDETLVDNNFIKRTGYKFIWNNKKYSSFEDYLEIFTSRQRKNIKSEREKVRKAGVTFDIKDQSSLVLEDWNDFYAFYKNTYLQRLQEPYLNLDFFKGIHKKREQLNPIIFFAEKDNKRVAASLFFNRKSVLYGRNWGTSRDIDSLHFECCYYQGIDYCIQNNIMQFDPGVQGEYKIRRGFEPTKTHSYHYVIKKDFRDAITEFCTKEKTEIDNYLKACNRYTPFKKKYKI